LPKELNVFSVNDEQFADDKSENLCKAEPMVDGLRVDTTVGHLMCLICVMMEVGFRALVSHGWPAAEVVTVP